jgi:hypothetical protein
MSCGVGCNLLQRFVAVGRLGDLMAVVAQVAGEAAANAPIIIDDENVH